MSFYKSNYSILNLKNALLIFFKLQSVNISENIYSGVNLYNFKLYT